ncbi:MAG: hypothetical protein V3U60_05585 [Gammaproteobacteria bacterium]
MTDLGPGCGEEAFRVVNALYGIKDWLGKQRIDRCFFSYQAAFGEKKDRRSFSFLAWPLLPRFLAGKAEVHEQHFGFEESF